MCPLYLPVSRDIEASDLDADRRLVDLLHGELELDDAFADFEPDFAADFQ